MIDTRWELEPSVAAMSGKSVVLWLTSCVALVGCNAIAKIAGAPKIVSVTVSAPAGILVGESAVATAVALGDDGRDHAELQRQKGLGSAVRFAARIMFSMTR